MSQAIAFPQPVEQDANQSFGAEVQIIVVDPRLADYGLPTAPATPHSAGLDLRAMFDEEELVIPAGTSVMVSTGLRVWIEHGRLAGLVLPRSGTGTKGLVLGNLVGLIDADYQGPLMVCLWNRNLNSDITVKRGDRVAQLMLVPFFQVVPKIVEDFAATTERGQGGFGSTGAQ